ncbi:MAG TPA: hypothetical protein VNW54_16450 [Granulicella sp.]|nr:hypothetical protein [Granulicella sp.]
MRNSAIPALLCCSLLPNPIVPQSQTKPHSTIAASKLPPAPKAGELPITRVSLYKNGVGFFEHSGRVTGDQTVSIAFTTAQLNDVLQSLTAIDRNGGRISGAGYNSTTPLDQQLKSLPFALGSDGSPVTAADLYSAIRGARIEITGAGPSLTGRLLDIEMRDTSQHTGDTTNIVQRPFLTVVSDSAAVRTFELTGATQVRLLDTTLHTDIGRYLELLDANRNQGLRRLTLTDTGSGTRDLQVSYLSEVPIWKSTYRILFTGSPTQSTATQTATLQGWSVVDNTTGSDWINVQLSLIAGAPQSFLQPLSVPYYGRRTEVPLPQEAQLTPQTHGSGTTIAMLKEDAAPPQMAGIAGMTGPATGPGPGGNYGGGNRSIGGSVVHGGVKGALGGPIAKNILMLPESAPPIPFETSAADSIAPATTTHAFDDYFAYNLTQPVTIRRNQSALVPILQTKIDAERLTLWSPRQPQALRALSITNTSNLTLDRGSFTIVEDGSFGGEGLLDPIHPGERRLLSYAADQAVRVTTDYSHNTQRVQRITISKGILKQTTAEIAEVEYLVHNAAPEPRTVVVEHPVRPGWTIDSDPKPFESTPTEHRFRLAAQPGETVRLHIGERHPLSQSYYLTNTSDEQLALLLRNANATPAILQQLEPVFQAKRALAGLDQQITAKQQALDDLVKDQSRLRDNLTALKSTAASEARPLARRYTAELLQQEDTLAALRKDLDALQQQRHAAQQQLSTAIDTLTLDEPL